MSKALQLGVALKALLLHQGFAVLGASGDSAPPPASVTAVAEGLRNSGASTLDGPDLRAKVLGDARPVGELSEAQAAPYARALAAYDEGSYADASRDAEVAIEALSVAQPSTRREALARQAQLLWGASLVQANQVSAARVHFRWALERDPFLIADRDRFPPPVQHAFERERTALANEPPARLVVGLANGATESVAPQLIVDGLPRGAVPRELSLPAHAATFWVERAQGNGWAHHGVLVSDRTLSVDLDLLLESALHANEGGLALAVPASIPKRQALLLALTTRAGKSDVVLVAKTQPSASAPRLTATRFNAQGTVLAETDFDADQAASAAVAHALLGLPPPAPVAVVHSDKKEEGFPVWPVVIGVVGVVAVASVLTAVFWPRSFEVALTPSTPR